MSYKPMKPEVKAAWIEALRSGKYEQGVGALKGFDNKFCCLGVLCDLSPKASWSKENDGRTAVRGYFFGGGIEFEVPTTSVRKWAGLSEEDVVDELTSSNDGERASFDTIANWISENL